MNQPIILALFDSSDEKFKNVLINSGILNKYLFSHLYRPDLFCGSIRIVVIKPILNIIRFYAKEEKIDFKSLV